MPGDASEPHLAGNTCKPVYPAAQRKGWKGGKERGWRNEREIESELRKDGGRARNI